METIVGELVVEGKVGLEGRRVGRIDGGKEEGNGVGD